MNYLKISGQFVRKMAMLLAFVFAACSETNSGNGVAGGTVEETGVYALSGRVGDVYPKLLNVVDGGMPTDSSEYEGSVFAAKGTIVTVYELDSLTLEKTGRSFVDTVDNDEGHFALENLTLNSPYVLIETLDSCYTKDCQERGVFYGANAVKLWRIEDVNFRMYPHVLSVLVNLRDIKEIGVSSLTTLKVPLLKKYFAEGESFADASEKAEDEILENLGIYEKLGRFERLSDEKSELAYVNELIRIRNSAMGDSIVRLEVEERDPALIFAAPPSVFVGRGEMLEQYYFNSKKMIDYKVGYLARVDGLGRCTENRENEVGKLKTLYHGKGSAVCRSGKWTLGFKTIEHSNGTMTDERDGKTYKTVTYNWGDVSQTWMAENLDFTDTTSLNVDSSLRANLIGNMDCYRSGLFNDEVDCGIYGHKYRWKAAMNIGTDDIKMISVDSLGDTTFFVKECLDVYADGSSGVGSHVFELRKSCDTLIAKFNSDNSLLLRTWKWNYSDFVTPSNRSAYQGICPDGWSIPTFDDWNTLFENMGRQYGVERYEVIPALYDAVATGFDLKGYIDLAFNDESRFVHVYSWNYANEFHVVDTSSYKIDFFNAGGQADFGFGTSARHGFVERTKEAPRGYTHPYGPYIFAAVRCIKN